jgi:hypothetical protein
MNITTQHEGAQAKQGEDEPTYGDDADYEQRTGNVAMWRKLRIQINTSFGYRRFSERVAMSDSTGAVWELWSSADQFFIHGRRRRDQDERVRWIDTHNGRQFADFFSIDRQQLCYRIAMEIQGIAFGTIPRGQHKAKMEKLATLSIAQMQMLGQRQLDMAKVRERLRNVGMRVDQMGALH